MEFEIIAGGEVTRASASDLQTACEALVAKHGKVDSVKPIVVLNGKANSTFSPSGLVHDADAKARIEAQHKALNDAGITVNASEQLYRTGTRMADVGYAMQASRKAEHDAALPLHEVADALVQAVKGEAREDIVMSAREFGAALSVNGKIHVNGFAVGEQAIRGLATRLEAPFLSYVLGLRDRIAEEHAKGDKRDRSAIASDKAKIADVLSHECARNPDAKIKLRTRKGVGDVFAVLSPDYEPADAPEAVAEIVRSMPRDAKATWAYDAESTAWELRASVWAPTPTEEQAVGEAFEGYVSFRSRDNGTSSFKGGGGVSLLRCLNASTYTASDSRVRRVHRGRILVDVSGMLRRATNAIAILCKAWGVARDSAIEAPSGVKLNDAIPGFWRHLLLARSSELAGVLPGRTETHVKGLSAAFFGERRDSSRIVRSDLAQGWTRYIQDQPAPVRREAESAIGAWIVSPREVACDLRA